MATFASFFNNTTITSQERDLFTELMGERNLVADDNLDGSKRKRKKPSAGRRRGRPHRKATVKVQKGSQKNAHGKSRVSKEAASAELPAWSIDDYEELSEALHLVSMDQNRDALGAQGRGSGLESAGSFDGKGKSEDEAKHILIPY